MNLFFVYVCQVVTLRMVHEKLLRLLPGGKQQALTSDHVFEPFSGLSPLHYNPYTEVSFGKLCVHMYAQVARGRCFHVLVDGCSTFSVYLILDQLKSCINIV